MDAARITAAAIETLDEVGLDALSMRRIARRLGVEVGGLYYHLPNKAALLAAMADELCREALGGHRGDDPVALCLAIRATLRSHRDAARVLAASPLAGSLGALELMERLITMLEPLVGDARANPAADTLLAYLTGYVLQEEAAMAAGRIAAPPDELRSRFPRIFGGIEEPDASFETAVRAIIAGYRC